MNQLAIVALAFFAGTSYASQRIVGGTDAAIENYPSIVQIEFQGIVSGIWSQNCAGIILNNIFILSAARCFDGTLYDPSYRRVRAGSETRNSGGVVLDVQRAINHPSYGVASEYDADITVVLLSGMLTFDTTIQQGLIPTPESVIADNLPVVKAGWGSTESGGDSATTLQQVSALVINRETCAESYASLPIPSTVTENMLCTGLPGSGGQDACTGDAGGPVYVGNIVVGIISWGFGCGLSDYPGVSTNVVPFSNWIVQTTLENS